MRTTVIAPVAGLLFLIVAPGAADVRLPAVFGDHMVMQRQMPLPVWGWADPGEEVRVEFAGQTAEATANDAGEWKTELAPLEAGGPHRLRVSGKNTVERRDILVGEVWLCSGQSNMEMGVQMCLNAADEIAAADHPQIRLFQIPKRFNASPQTDIEATWKRCTPEKPR